MAAVFSAVIPSISRRDRTAAAAVCCWKLSSPACRRRTSAEFELACSALNDSVTTLVLVAEVILFCSSLTSEAEAAVVASELLVPASAMLLTTKLGEVRAPIDGGGVDGVSGSGNVMMGSLESPPSPFSSTSSASSDLLSSSPTPLRAPAVAASVAALRLLKLLCCVLDDDVVTELDELRFFISEMLDCSSDRSDLTDEAFSSLTWWLRWLLLLVCCTRFATREELLVVDALLDCTICGHK